jgi:hypothetical protein
MKITITADISDDDEDPYEDGEYQGQPKNYRSEAGINYESTTQSYNRNKYPTTTPSYRRDNYLPSTRRYGNNYETSPSYNGNDNYDNRYPENYQAVTRPYGNRYNNERADRYQTAPSYDTKPVNTYNGNGNYNGRYGNNYDSNNYQAATRPYSNRYDNERVDRYQTAPSYDNRPNYYNEIDYSVDPYASPLYANQGSRYQANNYPASSDYNGNFLGNRLFIFEQPLLKYLFLS